MLHHYLWLPENISYPFNWLGTSRCWRLKMKMKSQRSKNFWSRVHQKQWSALVDSQCMGWYTMSTGSFCSRNESIAWVVFLLQVARLLPCGPCRVFACIWRVVRDCCLVFSCVDVICMRNSSTENVPYSLCCSLFAPNVAWSPATSDHGLKPWFSFNFSSWSSNFEAKSSWIGHDYKLTILEQIVPTHSQLVCTKCGCASPFLTGV